MAIFDENILREEEKLGGFNPGEPDDDVFYLGENTYPGDISEFEFKEEEPQIIEESGEILDASKIGAAEMSVWDFFEKEDSIESTQDAVEVVEEKPTMSDVANVVADIPSVSTEDASSIEEFVEDDDVELSEDEINSLFNSMEETKEPSPEPTKDNVEEITVDDDFKKFLQGQIDKRQVRKDREEKTEIEEAPIIKENEGEFVPVETTEDTQLIDITQMEADRPSKMIGLTSNPDNIDEDRIVDNTTNVDDKANEEIPKKEKKRKKAFPWLYAGVIFAGFLLLGTVGYFLYNNLFMKKSAEVLVDTLKHTEKPIAKSEPEKPIEHETKTDTIVEKPLDTVKVEKHAEKEVTKESNKVAEKEITKQVEKENAPKVEPKPTVEPKIVEKTKPIKREQSVPKKTIPKKVVPIEPKKTKTPNEEKSIVEIEKPKKEIKVEEPKTEPKVSVPKEQNNKPITSTLKDLGGEGEYVVQVYSSPSKEDAEVWLRKLQQKSGEGFITTQKIRDKVYYRVRFGNFKTKEEARSAAIRLGFTQSWIDRVK